MGEDARQAAAAGALAKEARELAAELQLTGLIRQFDALRDHDVPTSGAVPSKPDPVGAFEMRREGDFWTLVCDEGRLHLKDTRGMQTLHRLLTNPDQEFHVMISRRSAKERRTRATLAAPPLRGARFLPQTAWKT